MPPQQMMSLQRLVDLSNGVVTTLRPRVMRPLRRNLEGIEPIREEMARSGGFENIISQGVLTPESESYLQRLYSIQDTMQLSDRLGNESRNIPTVQEEADSLGNIIDITTKIKTHLEDCCDDIKLKLNEIQDSLKIFKSDLLERIQKLSDDLNNFITNKFDDLICFYLDEKQKLINYLPDLKQQLKELITEVISEEFDNVNQKLQTIENKIDNVNNRITILQEETVASFGALSGEVEIVNGLIVTQSTVLTAAFGAIETNFLGLSSEIKVKYILDEKSFKGRIILAEKNINNNTLDLHKNLNDYLNDVGKGFPFILQTEVCKHIVGESYAKWDSISMYFPTVIFIFNEVTESNKPRRSQIKIRFNKTSQEITDQDVTDITNKVRTYGNLGYNYGKTRGNYVSKDKRFKTTVYAEDESNICQVLDKIMDILPDKFDKELLSLTTIGNKRPSISKRNTDLFNVGLNTHNYDDVFPLQLKSVNIVVNGMRTIIKLC